MDELTMAEWAFVSEYATDWKAGAAYRRAFDYDGPFSNQYAYRLLQKPSVKIEVDKLRQGVLTAARLRVEDVVNDALQVMTADPRELFEIRQAACRYCHGENHRYQRTQNEYENDQRKTNFEHQGGMGFNPRLDPHPDCPECFGVGETVEELKDVRFLSPSAAALYFGGKRGKHGLEINLRSKDAARETLARFLGMNKETIKLQNVKASDLSDDELAAIAKGLAE